MNRKIFEEIISKIHNIGQIAFYVAGVSGGNLGSSSEKRYCNTNWSDGTMEMCQILEVCDDYVVLFAGKCGYQKDVYVPYTSITRIEEYGTNEWR